MELTTHATSIANGDLDRLPGTTVTVNPALARFQFRARNHPDRLQPQPPGHASYSPVTWRFLARALPVRLKETAMHPIITHDLMKARTSDLHRQAGRDALSLAARRARQAPTKKSTPFMPAHATAELIRHVLTALPGGRRPSQVPDRGGKHQPSALSGHRTSPASCPGGPPAAGNSGRPARLASTGRRAHPVPPGGDCPPLQLSEVMARYL